MKKLLLSTAIAALGVTGVASAHVPGSHGLAAAPWGNPQQVSQSDESGEMSGSMMNGMAQRMSGTIVDLLSYVTRRTATTSNNNGGHNGAKLPRPLGFVSDGQVYLIEITPMSGKYNGSPYSAVPSPTPSGNGNNNKNNEARMESRLAGDIGKTVSVMGRVYRRAGVEVLVVQSVM